MDLHTLLQNHFTKYKERIQKSEETGDSKYIYQNEQDKAYFQHMTYGDFKDLPRRTASDRVFCNKAFDITKIKNMMETKVVRLLCFTNVLKRKLLRLQTNLLLLTK